MTTPVPGEEELAIQLLGGFSVSIRGRAIDDAAWRLRKAKSLVKLLALAAKHRLHREQVMDVLWPELEPDGAANNLHKVLHIARNTMEPGGRGSFSYLLLQGEFVVLTAPGGLRTDVELFQTAASAAQLTLDPPLYEDALRLYAGDLLPEDRYEDWVAGRREELKAQWCTLSVQLASLYEQQGAVAIATDVLRQVVASDPAHEAAQLGLMRLLARSGQRHRALRQYEQLRDALQRELDVEPAPHIQELHNQLRSGIIMPGPVAPSTLPLTPPAGAQRERTPLPLIGREQELTYLRDRIAALAAGHGSVVLIRGAAGVGKSRLLAEAMEQARRLGTLTLQGAASPDQQQRDFGPIVDAIERAVNPPKASDRPAAGGRPPILGGGLPQLQAGDLPHAAPEGSPSGIPSGGNGQKEGGRAPAELGALWDDIAAHLHAIEPREAPREPSVQSTAPPEASDRRFGPAIFDSLPSGSHWPVFAALSVVFKRLTAHGPVVLAVDDLHRADECSLQLLHHLARKTRTMPLLLLGTCRADGAGSSGPLVPLLAELLREDTMQWLDIGGIGFQETERIIGELLGAPIDAEVLEVVHALAQGNAFYIQEAVYALRGRGQLYYANGQWRAHQHTSTVWGRDHLRRQQR
jgi:DNA-binding SARP family transcriptional activator